jgi:hypothetical protein
MDADEFQAWKDSPATQWVLRKLAEKAAEIETAAKEQLFYGTGLSPADWAAMQARVGFDRGTVNGLTFVLDLKPRDMDIDEEPKRDSTN